MSGKRCYGDACGVARALDVVGERWALMVVRELLLGPKRFTDIRDGLPHLSADVLAQRLRGLESAGIVERRVLPPPAPAKVYTLTESGRDLEPVILALGLWGGTHAAPPEAGMCMSFDSHILSLRTLFRPDLAAGFETRVRLLLDGQEFSAEIAAGEATIERGLEAHPDATVEAHPGTMLDVVHGRRDLDDALEAGELAIGGDEQVGRRFLGLFPLPSPVAS